MYTVCGYILLTFFKETAYIYCLMSSDMLFLPSSGVTLLMSSDVIPSIEITFIMFYVIIFYTSIHIVKLFVIYFKFTHTKECVCGRNV